MKKQPRKKFSFITNLEASELRLFIFGGTLALWVVAIVLLVMLIL